MLGPETVAGSQSFLGKARAILGLTRQTHAVTFTFTIPLTHVCRDSVIASDRLGEVQIRQTALCRILFE